MSDLLTAITPPVTTGDPNTISYDTPKHTEHTEHHRARMRSVTTSCSGHYAAIVSHEHEPLLNELMMAVAGGCGDNGATRVPNDPKKQRVGRSVSLSLSTLWVWV